MLKTTGKGHGKAGQAFWADLPLGPGVELIKHDVNGLAAFAKPEGVLSHPNRLGDEARSLLTVAYDPDQECYGWEATGTIDGAGEAGGRGDPGPKGDAAKRDHLAEAGGLGGSGSPAKRLWLLNRLDSATSGVILMADSAELARVVKEHFRTKQVRKVYVAVVFGAPHKAPDTWRDALEIVKRAGHIRAEAVSGGIPAECRMTVERAGRGIPRLSLIRLEPKTGRSHQLRVQCAKRNVPIVGDQTYGNFKANREFIRRTREKRMFLHSFETEFSYPFAGRTFSFVASAPVPREFGGAVE